MKPMAKINAPEICAPAIARVQANEKVAVVVTNS
jgi:hypothetical protein